MATQKHRNLSVETLEVTGTLTVNGKPYTEAGGDVFNVTVEETTISAVAPYPLPLPEKTTMAALRDRVEFLTSVLVAAGLIAEPQDRPTEADPRMTALLEAPEAPAEDTPAPAAQADADEAAEGQA